MRTLYTIGFTKKSAQDFFELLAQAGVEIVADVRLNNTGQLAGFTKKKDLQYFLSLIGIKYEHWSQFAPTKDIRSKYHTDCNWEEYERSYRKLVEHREALDQLDTSLLQRKRTCLLCSEPTPENCHRRIAAEIVANKIRDMEIVHL